MRAIRLVVVALTALAAISPAGASETYRQGTLFEWDRLGIDIVILPPGHGQIVNDGGVLPAGASDLDPLRNSYLRAAERGANLWMPAVRAFGPAWLAESLRIRVWVAGRDALPPAVLSGPEIVVAFHETTGPVLATSWGEGPCVASIAKLYHASFTENDVTTLTAHEVGHCLGLAHLDEPRPAEDLMQTVYQHPDGLSSTPVHCPSTLNVAALELVFRGAAGRGPGGGTAVLDPAVYRAPAAC